MKKVQKVTVLAIVLLIALSTKAFAMSQEDFVDYVTRAHTINGTTYKVNPSYRRELENYLSDHPITEDEADRMKVKFDSFFAYIDSIGVRKISNTTYSQKETLLAKANEISTIVGVSIKYNATDKTIEFFDRNGKKITAIKVVDYDYLVQTGSSNYAYVAVPAGFALMAIAGITIFKKMV